MNNDVHQSKGAAATTVAVNGTTLYTERRGEGLPLLLIHGGGEDADMLGHQADGLVAAGYDVVSYDRRGTRRSGRENWPGGGADQHADDAAGLIRELGWTVPTVVGVSSGGVVALALAGHHPKSVGSIVAWEPPAVGIIDGGVEATAAIVAPVHAHLASHPDDFAGAQAILLSTVLGFPVSVDDPAFASARVNAEPFVRDEPAITTVASTGRAWLAQTSRSPSARRPTTSSPPRQTSSPAGSAARPSVSTPTTRCTSPIRACWRASSGWAISRARSVDEAVQAYSEAITSPE